MKRFLLFFFIFLFAGIFFAFSQNKNKILCVAPTVTMSSNVTVCSGQNASISSAGSGTSSPYTYAWSPAGNVACPTCSNTTANPTTQTTYTCLVTDNITCTNTGTVTVFVNPTPTVTITGALTVCPGNSTTLTGNGGVTYSWIPSSQTTTNITVTPTANTTYTVVGTNASSCTSTAVATVSINPTPTITITGNATICNGQSTTLTGNGGTTYSWIPTSQTTTNITVNPTTGTTYTVVGTNASGCTSSGTKSVTVNPTPTITITGALTVCPGNSTTLTGNGGTTYSWIPTSQTTTNITVIPTSNTTYTVVGTNSLTCSENAIATVSINPTPTITITGNATICSGNSTTLSGNGGLTYSWIPTSQTTTDITVSPTTNGTTYTVVGTDASGCTNSGTQSLTVNPLPFSNAGPDYTICLGGQVTITGSGNGTYNWAPATDLSCTTCANPVASPSTTITYTLSVTNGCGTANDDMTITEGTPPSVSAGSPVTICPGGSTGLNASGSGTFVWSPAGSLSCTSCASPTATPSVTTTYTVTLSSSCGTNSDMVTVTIDNPTASISPPSPICVGQSATLCASGGNTYLWNNSQTTSCITVSPTTLTGYTVTTSDTYNCTAIASQTLTVNSLPNPSIAGNASICAGSNDTLTAFGGTSYSWSTTETTTSIIVSPTTNSSYTVIATNGNNCTNTATIAVNTSPQPTANAGPDATICSGNTVTLSATGNGTYLWNPGGQTTSSISVSPTGTTTYTLSVTNACGTATDNSVVTVNSLPSVAINGNTSICPGSADTLIATGVGTFVWNTSSTNNSIFVNPTTATGYTVTVTDNNGCTNSASTTVNMSSVTASVSGTTAICSGQSSTLTASGGNNYSWNTTATTASIIINPTSTSSYTVVATNSLGCTGSAIVTVTVTPQPIATVSANDSAFCFGISTTLNAGGGATYLWSPSTGMNITTIANPTASPTVTTTYTVIVANGTCADTANITITVNPLPTPSVTATPSNLICIGGCATLNATGGIGYIWNPGGQSTAAITVCPTSTTAYIATVTDANGCTANASVSLNVFPTITVSINGDTNLCKGSSTILTAQSQGSVYSWNTGQTTSSIIVSPTTNTSYTVSVSNGACSDDTSITVIVYPTPTVTVGPSISISIGDEATLSGTSSTGMYNWSPSGGLSCNNCANPIVSPTSSTTYTLCTTDTAPPFCTTCDTIRVNVIIECGDVFIPSAFSPNGDGKNDYASIRSPCIKDLDFTIYNRWGAIVFHSTDVRMATNPQFGWDGTLNGKLLDPAVFFYIINVDLINGQFKNYHGNITLVH